MTQFLLILAQIVAFQTKDLNTNPVPSHLMDALQSNVCAHTTKGSGEQAYFDLLEEYEAKHHVKLVDEVWEIVDQCD